MKRYLILSLLFIGLNKTASAIPEENVIWLDCEVLQTIDKENYSSGVPDKRHEERTERQMIRIDLFRKTKSGYYKELNQYFSTVNNVSVENDEIDWYDHTTRKDFVVSGSVNRFTGAFSETDIERSMRGSFIVNQDIRRQGTCTPVSPPVPAQHKF